MRNRELAKRLGYDSVDELCSDNNISMSSISHHRKRDTWADKERLIILDRYNLDSDKLLDALETLERVKGLSNKQQNNE